MSLDRSNNPSEHCSRYDVYLVQQDEPPLAARQEVHHLLCCVRAIMRVRDLFKHEHRVERGVKEGRTIE